MARKAHFIGIAGKGMSAVALLLREAGWTISGSDEGFYPPVSEYLERANISFNSGYRADNIPKDAELIVIGKNAKLVPDSNAEVAAAMQSGIKVVSFADIINDLTKSTDNIVVAGSYGKSTSTALLSWCLKEAGRDPSYFIGEICKGFDAHAHKGGGSVFVLEGDEYPSSNWDATSKFLHYNAHSVLLTSATHDHVNIFPTHEEYLKPFRDLLASLPEDGLVIAGNEPFARALAEGSGRRTVTYGMNDGSDWYPADIRYGMPTTFALMHKGERLAELTTTQLGAHNVENIVGISALLLEKELLTAEELARGVASFQGVKRRMESLAPKSRVPVFEGFGSSYEKARAAVEAMKLHFPSRRLLVVFEPHTFTWRNRSAIGHYDDVFAGAEKVYIYEPASQGAHTHAQLSQEEITERVRAAGFNVASIGSAGSALDMLRADLNENDCVLLLTSGDLGGLIKSIPALAQEQFPA